MAIKEKTLEDGVQWIDVCDPSVTEMEQLSSQHRLNEHTVKDCMMPEHLPKYEFDDEVQVHFLILRYYSHSTDRHADSIQQLTNKIAIFYTGKALITIHKKDAAFLEKIARLDEKKKITGTALLVKITWEALETFDDPANRLSEQLDFYEVQVMLRKSNDDVTSSLFYLKRQSLLSQKVLMLMQEPINHIRVADGEEAVLQDLRDQHLKMQTLYGQLLEEVNNLLTISTSFSAQRTNEVVRVLTLFSVFFMPLTFIVGIYGMNFHFMPELHQRWGYPAVLVFMAAITFVIYRWFRRKKWL